MSIVYSNHRIMYQWHYSRRPSRGVEHFFRETLAKDDKPNIVNLDEYFARNSNPKFNRDYYRSCKEFIEKINIQVGEELDTNAGNVITVYGMDGNMPDDNSELEKIKGLYQRLYLEGLSQKGHKINNAGDIYPNYYEDLYSKGYKPYEELEKSLGMEHDITRQTDEEFIRTLQKRVDGLKQCIDKPEGQFPEAMDYFKDEYSRETVNNASIMEQCRKIYYSHITLQNSYRIDSDEKYRNEVIDLYKKTYSNPKEEAFARTFLPPEYFKDNNELDIDKIKKLIFSNNRVYRQMR